MLLLLCICVSGGPIEKAATAWTASATTGSVLTCSGLMVEADITGCVPEDIVISDPSVSWPGIEVIVVLDKFGRQGMFGTLSRLATDAG